MRAVYFKNGNISIIETARPQPGQGEALVRVRLAGICRTDLELLEGYYDFKGIPGHEFVGEVVQAPARPDLAGRRVTADINCGCGACGPCLSGDFHHCPDRKVIGIKGRDGVFAEYVAVPVANLYQVPDDLSDDQVVWAEPLAAALRPTDQVEITPEVRLGVLGDGKIGLLTALALRPFCPGLILIGRYAHRLDLARDLGLETMRLEPPEGRIPGHGDLFDLVIEATGRPEGVGLALSLVRARGRVVVKTTSHLPSQINLAGFVVDEKILIGSRCGDIGRAIEYLGQAFFDPSRLVEAVYPLADFHKAFRRARRPGAGKILLKY